MIALVSGTVAHVGLDEVIVSVAGIGYRILLTPAHASECVVGEAVELHTSMVVREESLTLYGFREADERFVFERLQTVSGIGPRIALAALAVLRPDEIRSAVSNADLSVLQRIPGVGRKSAQRMALEIGDKLGLPASLPSATAGTAKASPNGVVEAEVRAALIQLGWSQAVASSHVEALAQEGMTSSELLRACLVELGGARGR